MASGSRLRGEAHLGLSSEPGIPESRDEYGSRLLSDGGCSELSVDRMSVCSMYVLLLKARGGAGGVRCRSGAVTSASPPPASPEGCRGGPPYPASAISQSVSSFDSSISVDKSQKTSKFSLDSCCHTQNTLDCQQLRFQNPAKSRLTKYFPETRHTSTTKLCISDQTHKWRTLRVSGVRVVALIGIPARRLLRWRRRGTAVHVVDALVVAAAAAARVVGVPLGARVTPVPPRAPVPLVVRHRPAAKPENGAL